MSAPPVLSVVAPPAPDKRPPTIEDLYRRARKDWPEISIVDWVFLEAKASGKREVASAQLKRLHEEDYLVRARASTYTSDVARKLVMDEAPDPLRFHRAEQAVADAVEQVSACGRMISLLQGRVTK